MPMLKLGSIYRVRVKGVNENGLVVSVGDNQVGFIPLCEISREAEENPRAFFRKNDQLRAMLVLRSSDGKRLVFSLKSVEEHSRKTSPAAEEDAREPEFDQLFQKFKRESQWRLSLWKEGIEAKRKRGRS
ncbi:MAG: S1 RNA-binding domain-containing protein [bacterium JZ-2024 1]